MAIMKLFVALAFLVAGSMAISCSDFVSKADFNEVMGNQKVWKYMDTNHDTENCNIAHYDGTEDTANWNVKYANGTEHYTCPMTKIKDPKIIKKWTLNVRESGSNYVLGIAAFEKEKWFCWFQCGFGGKFVDFWHCCTSDDTLAANKEKWDEEWKKTGMELDPVTKIYRNRNNCPA